MVKGALGFAAGWLFLAASAVAAPLPGPLPPVSLTARDQPIGSFLNSLFEQAGRPVVISPALTGTVNGTFTGAGDKVLRDISHAFNLVTYYDGGTIYVNALGELASRTLEVGPGGPQRLTRQVAQLGLADARDFVRPASATTAVVTGVPRFLDQVGELNKPSTAAAGGYAQAAETRTIPLEFRVFYLRYARADDTTVSSGGHEVRLPGVATILRSLVLDSRERGGGYGSRTIRQSAQRVGGTGLAAVPPDQSQSAILGLPPSPGAAYAYQGAPSQVFVNGGGNEGGETPPATVDFVRIEANPAMNAIIVRDTPARMAAYDGLIRAIDVEPQLVEVEATIIDINTTRLRQLGIDFNLTTGGFGALFNTSGASNTPLQPNFAQSPRQQQGSILNPVVDGLSISTVIGAGRQFISRINALETKGAARVVSRPQVMTLSNVEAVFDRSRTFYVRVAGQQNVDLFNVTAGTTLRVTPSVFRDQGQTRVRLLVNIEDGSISATDKVDEIPLVDRASISTQALILAGESLLIGGLTTDSDTNNQTKIPLLGDIPVLGNLFKKSTRQHDRIERLFLITPRLASLTPRSVASVAGQTVTTAAVPVTVPNR